jgi:hypothetical protein
VWLKIEFQYIFFQKFAIKPAAFIWVKTVEALLILGSTHFDALDEHSFQNTSKLAEQGFYIYCL